MNSPSYTVIIATHRRSELLKRALDSVLAQTFPCHQIIVVSDVVDPDAYQVASALLRPRDIFVQCPGIRGPATSRNVALKLVTGSDVVFLDDDDGFRENFLANVSALRGGQATGEILFTDFEVIHEHEEGKVTPVSLGDFALEQIWIKNFIPNNCVIYPYSSLENLTFDEAVAYEDWDFLLSVHTKVRLRHLAINGPVIYKNANAEEKNRGEKNNENLLECYIRAYKKHPATPAIRERRKAFFGAIGIDIEAFLQG
jgi:glycosyltransferase involved in cell wall biosynthesis